MRGTPSDSLTRSILEGGVRKGWGAPGQAGAHRLAGSASAQDAFAPDFACSRTTEPGYRFETAFAVGSDVEE
ncbi:hypothetical protein SSBG_02168 [Streptomyces sp. SPB074]|nr:hypothetical protein SSBG_02168 [Streptomyces sp. SPB074]